MIGVAVLEPAGNEEETQPFRPSGCILGPRSHENEVGIGIGAKPLFAVDLPTGRSKTLAVRGSLNVIGTDVGPS